MNNKIKKFIVSIASGIMLIMLGCVVHAAPLMNYPCTVTQPDGTEITVYFYGDEIYSYMADSEGNVIVENPYNGYYVYASLVDGEIIATDYVVGMEISGNQGGSNSSFLKAKDIPQSEYITAYANSRFYKSENTPEAMSLDYEDKDFNGMDINNIVVFIEFENSTYSQNRLSFYDNLFNTGKASAKNYYNETSYGKLSITSTFYPKSNTANVFAYTDIHNADYYNARNYNYDWEEQGVREQAMFKRALDHVKDQIPEDLDLDKNNDGYVDMITFVLPGVLASGSNQVCWPHQWAFFSEYTTEINGLETDLYNVQIEGALRGQKADDGDTETLQKASAIIAHETHHILGFPDMYYYDYAWPTNCDSLGEWDIMCSSDGGHASAYMKCTYGGWLDIPEIKEDGTYTLNPLQDGGTCAYKLRSPNSANEYFIVEYRKQKGNFEKNIPNTGLVVYRVLANKHTLGNCDATESDGTDDELRYLVCKQSGSYSPNLSSGGAAGISITSISAKGETASFKVSFNEKKYLTYFNDRNLADAVASAIGKSESQITNSDIRSITSLSIDGGTYKQNYDLTGIEQLTGLKTLSLTNCGIDDISALQGLVHLTSLTLNDNHITDITALSNLTNLKTLNLRGNYIDDYSPTSAYYDNLTTKDFSLTDENDAVFFVPNASNGILGTAYVQLSNTVGPRIYYSLEKYDTETKTLMSRKRGYVRVSNSAATKKIIIPDTISDDDNTYVILKTYENDTFRHVMSETVIDDTVMDLGNLG